VKEEVDGVILVAGSARLVQGLIAADLLDELRLMVFPVTLGGGKRLFADDGRKVPLDLTDARTIGAGVQLLTYERTAAA
jgi:dihydrofolate reductase